MPKTVQFEGKRFHESCFESFLNGQRTKNKVVSDWRPATQILEDKDLESTDTCEECGGTLVQRDSMVDTMNKSVSPRDDDDDDDKDDVTDTPPPTQQHRRRR